MEWLLPSCQFLVPLVQYPHIQEDASPFASTTGVLLLDQPVRSVGMSQTLARHLYRLRALALAISLVLILHQNSALLDMTRAYN